MNITLVDIGKELQEIENAIIEAEGEITPQIEARFEELKALVPKKAFKIANYIDMAKNEIDYCDKKIAEYQQKKKQRKSKIAWLENLLMYGLKELSEDGTFKQGVNEIKIAKNPHKVIIDDKDKIPAKYKDVVTDVKPRLNDIKADLKKGETIDGCHLEQGEKIKIT